MRRTAERRQAVKMNPVLRRVLDRREAGSGPVEAVVTLRVAKSAKSVPSPGRLEAAG